MREMDLIIEGHDFKFTRNWFRTRNLATFREHIYPHWRDKQDLTYLELGVFEGMSMVWMLQHLLTSRHDRAVGIDPWLMTTKLSGEFMEEVMKRAHFNLAQWMIPPDEANMTLIRANSAEVLRRMCGKGYAGITKDSVDICMIDGNHNAPAVYDDAVHCLQLVKPGGWLLFDDVENVSTKRNHVKHGLSWFMRECYERVKFLWKHRFMEAFEVL
jgi:predicted O-methyltransferase YrrM